MSCFDGLINLKGCSVTEVPGSVYSLNSLPGISIKAFQDAANSEQGTYVGVWENINERAEASIKNTILSFLRGRYKISRVIRTVDISSITQDSSVADNLYKGILINLSFSTNENWRLSPFQNISIQSVRYYKVSGSTETTLNINFFNYLTKEILFTKTVDVSTFSTGWNDIPVNKNFDVAQLGIGYKQTKDTLSYLTNDANGFYAYACDECFQSECGQIRGFVSSNDKISGTLSLNDTIIGLQAMMTIGCSYDAAVCSNKLLFAEAYWYLLGIEFMLERQYSERINFMTTVLKEEAVELQALYQTKYEEALKNALDGFTFDCDACLQCDNQVQFFPQLP